MTEHEAHDERFSNKTRQETAQIHVPEKKSSQQKSSSSSLTSPYFVAGMLGSVIAVASIGFAQQGGLPIIEIIPTPEGVPAGEVSDSDPGSAPNDSSKSTSPAKLAMNENVVNEDRDEVKQGLSGERSNQQQDAQVDIVGPEEYTDWKVPELALVISGNQHGYIEPCGCTGLENQKGGVARRFTFLKQLENVGWNLAPIDAGNQVRRFGRQAEIKFQRTAEALKEMGYQAVAFGPDDVRLGVGELIAVAASDDPSSALYVSANVVLLDPALMPQYKVFEQAGIKVGVTSVLDPQSLDVKPSDEIIIEPMVESTQNALNSINADSADFRVLTFFGAEKAAQQLVRDVQGFDLIVVSGGYGEPTYQAQPIEGTQTRMIVTGNKGMYVGIVGLYKDEPFKYGRVALTHEFEDAKEMRSLMAEYQNQLRDVGLEKLGLSPIAHSSGRKFVGTETCGKCHTTAYDIWEGTPHSHATESLVNPGERSDVPRHFDPECISCHVTGWNPQKYYPYASGYWSLETTEHLTGNGCENCHGPGAEHSAAEVEGSGVSEIARQKLRDAMKLPLEKAREKCMECHDLDNSPDFHKDDAFEDIYWPEVEHYGLD